MASLADLNKKQAAKFIEGFNSHVDDMAGSSRHKYRLGTVAYYGYEAARTLILHAQLKASNPFLEKISAADFQAIQEGWEKKADYFGYGPNSATPLSIVYL
jgi:hypothetical protein